jgi:hypothetical protein
MKKEQYVADVMQKQSESIQFMLDKNDAIMGLKGMMDSVEVLSDDYMYLLSVIVKVDKIENPFKK